MNRPIDIAWIAAILASQAFIPLRAEAQFQFEMDGADSQAMPRLAPGFRIDLVARDPLVRNVCALAFDAQGRLFVSQGPQYRHPKPETPGDWISILIDEDNDGRAEKAKTFAAGFNSIQALAWKGKDLWVANAPDLTVVRDLDGDDEADEYVLVFSGLGTLEHALHGLNWAPDGKLYLSKGDTPVQPYAPRAFRDLMHVPSNFPDTQPLQTFRKGQYRKTYEVPMDGHTEGGILRCDNLGANLEIFCRGLRNPWDITFDDEFNWLGTDQDDSSQRDRIFMPFYGAHFGHRHRWSNSWTGDNHLPTAPASGYFPHSDGSGVGIVFYTAPHFPESYRGTWLIGDWLLMSIYQFRPAWSGSLLTWQDGKLSYLAQPGDRLPLFRPTDMEAGPDGALYVGGWGKEYGAKWVNGQLANEGRVFRIDSQQAPAIPAHTWNTPRRALPIQQWSIDDLVSDLDTHLPVWRVNAQDELVRRGSNIQRDLVGRLSAPGISTRLQTWLAWTLGRIDLHDRSIDTWFAEQASSPTASLNLRIQSLRILAHRIRHAPQARALPEPALANLDHPDARLRFEAVQAIWQARQTQLTAALIERLAVEPDRLTFYCLWRATQELAPLEQRQKLLRDSRGPVRLGALLGLMESNEVSGQDVIAQSHDSDPRVRQIANNWLSRVGYGVQDKSKLLALLYQHDHRTVNAELRMNLLRELRKFQLTDSELESFQQRFYHHWRGRTDEVFPDEKAKEIALALEIMASNEKAIPIFWDALGHDWDDVRAAALRYFPRLGESGFKFLEQKICATPPPPQEHERALQALLEFDFKRRVWRPDAELTAHLLAWFEQTRRPATQLKILTALAAIPAEHWAGIEPVRNRARSIAQNAANHPDARIDQAARRLAEPLGVEISTPTRPPIDIEQVLARLDHANPKRGETLFFDAGRANCSACHLVAGRGRSFGPDLTLVAARNEPRAIIESILDPNANVIEGFRRTRLKTHQGDEFEGMIFGETGHAVDLFQVDGTTRTFLKSEITERLNMSESLMPAIFDQILTAGEIADLTAWLVQQGKASRTHSEQNGASSASPTRPLADAGLQSARDSQLTGTSPDQPPGAQSAEFQLIDLPGRREIRLGPQVIAVYVFEDPLIRRPYFMSLKLPNGLQVTRNHPPKDSDAQDHSTMHPGLWLGFGDLNGADFWRNKATVEHIGFINTSIDGARQARFTVRNRYRDDSRVICEQVATYTFRPSEHGYLLAIDTAFTPVNGEFYFGVQEEMGLGVRVATPLAVNRGGTMRDSEGRTNEKEIWGKTGRWLDYFGAHEGQLAGVLLMTHPDNPRPCWFHARDYGVVVANPFERPDLHKDSRTIVRPGESYRLRFGVYIHAGELVRAEAEAAYDEYSRLAATSNASAQDNASRTIAISNASPNPQAGVAAARPAGHRTDIRIATMRLGSSWYVFGATLYKLLRDNLPSSSRIEVIAKGGGVGNPTMVDSGKASLALANVCTAVWARHGHPSAYNGRQHDQLVSLVGGLNSVWYVIMAREEYIARTGNDTLEKIVLGADPVRIVMKPRGSTIPVIADLIFEALGASRQKIEARGGRILQVETQQIPELIRDGRADVYFEAAPLGHPTVTEVSLTGKVRFLEIPPRVIEALAAQGLTPSSMPKFFQGQAAPIPSVDLGTVVIANKNLPDEIAYVIAKTICENANAMAKAHKAWSRFKPELAGQPGNVGIPLHPGAERFYRERGWISKPRQ